MLPKFRPARVLKYGLHTTLCFLDLRCFKLKIPDGSLVHMGDTTPDRPCSDLLGIFLGIGSTPYRNPHYAAVVKKPELFQVLLLAAFNSTTEVRRSRQRDIAAGILPARDGESMDSLAIEAAEASVIAG